MIRSENPLVHALLSHFQNESWWFKVIHFSALPSSYNSFWEMTTGIKLDTLENQSPKFVSVRRFWSLRTWTIKRYILIKQLRNGIFVKSNTKRFTEFSNCNLSRKLVLTYLTFFSLMLKNMGFPLTVPNRTSKCRLDSLQSPEFYSCMQFEIRKRLACWFC